MQEKDRKESMTVSSTNMKIPFCPIHVQVNNYEIVVNIFHISHNLPESTQFVQFMSC